MDILKQNYLIMNGQCSASYMVLMPNNLCDLTPFCIDKVLFKKELPVALQVIDVIDELPPAREKLTLIELDGSTPFFLLIPKAPLYLLPLGVKLFFWMEKYSWKRKSKHPLAKKCFTAVFKGGSIINITKAKTSYFRGSVGLLEIYDFNVCHLNFHVLGSPVPFPDTL